MTQHDHKWRALANFARNSRLLALLDQAGLATLVEHGEIVFAAPGQLLVRQGEVGDTFFLVVVGEVAVTVREAGDKEVARLGPGSFFGEIAVVTRQPRTATVTAAVPTELIRFPREPLVALIQRYPRLREVIGSVGLARSEENLRRAQAGEKAASAEAGLAEALEGDEPGLTEALEGEEPGLAEALEGPEPESGDEVDLTDDDERDGGG